MIDLDATYRRLARSWTHEQLAAGYQQAVQRAAGIVDTAHGNDLARPITVLATAIPPAASLSVAIHVVHVLPDGARPGLADVLIATAEGNAADALHRCHQALELDRKDHGYLAGEWLTTVYDIAIALLESARRDEEPPTVVRQAQEAISWLSRSIVELDRGSPETTSAIAEALARVLVVWLFASGARLRG